MTFITSVTTVLGQNIKTGKAVKGCGSQDLIAPLGVTLKIQEQSDPNSSSHNCADLPAFTYLANFGNGHSIVVACSGSSWQRGVHATVWHFYDNRIVFCCPEASVSDVYLFIFKMLEQLFFNSFR